MVPRADYRLRHPPDDPSGIASTLFAWGSDGHQIVALIAEEHLSREPKHQIHELLGADVNISDAEIASWANNIRREKRSAGPWHYVDIPTDAAGLDEERDTCETFLRSA